MRKKQPWRSLKLARQILLHLLYSSSRRPNFFDEMDSFLLNFGPPVVSLGPAMNPVSSLVVVTREVVVGSDEESHDLARVVHLAAVGCSGRMVPQNVW